MISDFFSSVKLNFLWHNISISDCGFVIADVAIFIALSKKILNLQSEILNNISIDFSQHFYE